MYLFRQPALVFSPRIQSTAVYLHFTEPIRDNIRALLGKFFRGLFDEGGQS